MMQRITVLVSFLAYFVAADTRAPAPPGARSAPASGTRLLRGVPVPQWHSGEAWECRWESPQGQGTFTWSVRREDRDDETDSDVVAVGPHEEWYDRKADLATCMQTVDGTVETRNVPPQQQYAWPLELGTR